MSLGLGWSRLPGQLHYWCAGLKTQLLGPSLGGLFSDTHCAIFNAAFDNLEDTGWGICIRGGGGRSDSLEPGPVLA